MGLSLNATECGTKGIPGNIWGDMYDTFTFSATDWRTIQGGLNRLPEAFGPILGDKVIFKTRISKLAFEDDKISVQWKDNPYDETYHAKTFDDVIVAVPFTIVRTWHLPGNTFQCFQGYFLRSLTNISIYRAAIYFGTGH